MRHTVVRRAACVALAGALAVGGAAALVGCDASAGQPAPSAGQVQGRRFTVPQAYFGAKAEKSCVAELEAFGGSDVERNDDGSFTVTMSDAAFEAFRDDDLERTRKLLDAIPHSRDFPQVDSVTYDDGLTDVVLVCSKDDMGTQGENAASTVIYAACLYQVIAGDELSCTVTLQNQAGQTIDTYSLPEAQ